MPNVTGSNPVPLAKQGSIAQVGQSTRLITESVQVRNRVESPNCFIAQLVERSPDKGEVTGSSPVEATKHPINEYICWGAGEAFTFNQSSECTL